MNERSPWLAPSLLNLGVLFALIAALVAEGWWDWLSWALLFLPLVILGMALLRRRRDEA